MSSSCRERYVNVPKLPCPPRLLVAVLQRLSMTTAYIKWNDPVTMHDLSDLQSLD